jgi:hypothetical protein
VIPVASRITRAAAVLLLAACVPMALHVPRSAWSDGRTTLAGLYVLEVSDSLLLKTRRALEAAKPSWVGLSAADRSLREEGVRQEVWREHGPEGYEVLALLPDGRFFHAMGDWSRRCASGTWTIEDGGLQLRWRRTDGLDVISEAVTAATVREGVLTIQEYWTSSTRPDGGQVPTFGFHLAPHRLRRCD